jgi:hypothetical protein
LTEQWKTALRPFADRLADLRREIAKRCEGLSDSELAELRNATTLPSQTNCYWAIYSVAPMVAQEIAAEQQHRIAQQFYGVVEESGGLA